MTNIERQQHWQAIIQQWRESGLSKTAFCKQHNIATSGFYYWLKRLAPNEINVASSFSPVVASLQPQPIDSMMSLAVAELRLQFPAAHLGSVLTQLKSAGIVDA